MKTFFLTTFICVLAQGITAQQFSVPVSLCNETGTNQFQYIMDGYGVFTDSMEIHVELLNPIDNTVIFSGQHSMSDLFVSTLIDFSYDPSSGAYHFAIGTFATSDKILHMWLMSNNQKEQEVYYQE